jgi:hypothetical protein
MPPRTARRHRHDYSGRNCMPGFTKTFVALGETTTERLGFCFLLMTDFLSARLIRFLTQEVEYVISEKTEYWSDQYSQDLNNLMSHFSSIDSLN